MPFFNIEQIAGKVPVRDENSHCIIAIDGGSGSGKSTLAEEWKMFSPRVQVIILDDFLINAPDEVLAKRSARENFEICFDTGYIENSILAPLYEGRAAKFGVLNPRSEIYAKEFTVRPEGIIIIEGVYSHRPQWKKYFSFRIWLEMSASLRMERMRQRSANTTIEMLCWQRTEKWYMETVNPAGSADMVVQVNDCV